VTSFPRVSETFIINEIIELERQGFDVDVRAPSAFPGSLRELERYDFVILSDVPADLVSLSSQELIESYLRELGGGFLFAGGPNGYGPGGWFHTTIERILPVRTASSHGMVRAAATCSARSAMI